MHGAPVEGVAVLSLTTSACSRPKRSIALGDRRKPSRNRQRFGHRPYCSAYRKSWRGLVRVEVDRLPARPYKPQVLWLWWAGPGAPDLDVLWRAYVRRFDLEHTLRFLKQALG